VWVWAYAHAPAASRKLFARADPRGDSLVAMKVSKECLRRAEDCEQRAAACDPGSTRDSLLNTAAEWRRMPEAAVVGETALRLAAGMSKRD
jgi:hypothetical protein